VVSTAFDAASTGVSLVCFIVPILFIVCLMVLMLLLFRWRIGRSDRRIGPPAVARY
jgi:NADH:ubiquinone oxidoreductase subunit H